MHFRTILERVGSTPGAESPQRFHHQRLQNAYLETILLTALASHLGKEPEVRLTGREHIEQGLKRGRGGILWVSPSSCSDFIVKMALHRAGYSPSHLSHYCHRSSETLTGQHTITKIRVMVENRYLRERLILSPADKIGPLKALRCRLRENTVVSITATGGPNFLPCPCLGGHIDLAIGAARLAITSGATLLPVFAHLDGDLRFRVQVRRTVTVPANAPRTGAEQDLTRQFGESLERHLRRFPSQWGRWENWHAAEST